MRVCKTMLGNKRGPVEVESRADDGILEAGMYHLRDFELFVASCHPCCCQAGEEGADDHEVASCSLLGH